MTEPQQPIDLVVSVVREALTCDRAECTPDDHAKFVDENFRIAHAEINENR